MIDARHLYLILGSGPSNPMTVYDVKVWQNSMPTISAPCRRYLHTRRRGRPNRDAQPERNQEQHRRGEARSSSGRPSLNPRPVSVEGTTDRLQRLRRSGHRAGRPLETLGGKMVQENSYGGWSQKQAPPVHGRRCCARRHDVTPAPTEPRSPPPQKPDHRRPAIAGPSSSQVEGTADRL